MTEAALPRTTKASGPAVPVIVEQRVGPPAALWGMGILIASEGTLFICLVASYFYLRFETHPWPPDGIAPPRVAIPLIMTAILVATSVPMQLAWRAAQAGRLAAARLALVCALVVQAGYLAYEIHDFQDQLNRVAVTRDAYTSAYYVLLGADHAHVALGILFDVWLLGKLARGLTTYRVNAAQAIMWYWHFVNVVTIIVIGTLLSANV